MTEHFITLSTTEPNNNVGIVKFRHADVNSQAIVAQIVENGQPKNFEGLQPFFCLMAQEVTGQGVSEEVVTSYDEKKGTLTYYASDNALQMVGRNEAYFSFRKQVGDKWVQQFSTRSFHYIVEKSIYSQPFKDSNYWWTFKELYGSFNNFVIESQQNLESLSKEFQDYLQGEDSSWKIIPDVSSLKGGKGAKITITQFDEAKAANVSGVIGVENNDVYFSPDLASRGMIGWPFIKWNFAFEIVANIEGRLSVSLDIVTQDKFNRIKLVDYLIPAKQTRQKISVLTPNVNDLGVIKNYKDVIAVNFVITATGSAGDQFDYSIARPFISQALDGVSSVGDIYFSQKVKKVDNYFPDADFVTANPKLMIYNDSISGSIVQYIGKNWLNISKVSPVDQGESNDIYFPISQKTVPFPINDVRKTNWLLSFNIVTKDFCTVYAYFDYWTTDNDVQNRIELGSLLSWAGSINKAEFEMPSLNYNYINQNKTISKCNFVITTDQDDLDYKITELLIKMNDRG